MDGKGTPLSEERRRRGACAICDQSNSIVRLCAKCRREPANAGWSQRTMLGDRAWIESPPSEERHPTQLTAREHLAALHGGRLRGVGERTRQILQLVGFYRITDRRRPTGKARRHQEWIVVRRPLHLAEVAFLVGVTPAAVRRTLRRYEPLLRAVLKSHAPPSE